MKSALIIFYALNLGNFCAGIPVFPNLDRTVNPCDDFYKFTCGNFASEHPLASGEQLVDHFTILQKEIHDLMKIVLKSTRNENEPEAVQKVKAFYQSCIDLEYTSQLRPRQIELVQKFQWPVVSDLYNESKDEKFTWEEMASVTNKYGVDLFFDFITIPSLRNSSTNSLLMDLSTVTEMGIRPDFEVLLGDRTELYQKFLQKSALHLRDLIYSYKTDAQVSEEIKNTVDFMELLNKGGVKPSEPIDSLLPEGPLRNLQQWTDKYFPSLQIDWVQYFNEMIDDPLKKVNDTTLIIITDKYTVYGILNLYRKSSPRQIRNYITARLITRMASDGDEHIRNYWISYRNASGENLLERDDFCARKAYSNVDLSKALTYEYQRYHFNNGKLRNVQKMHDEILEIFLEMFSESQWMDECSKSNATRKLLNMVTLLGYPEEILNIDELDSFYDDLKICTWDNYGNEERVNRKTQKSLLKHVLEEKRRTLWNLSPLIVNAFYNRGMNRMTIPVSILNSIFFSNEYNVLDYARLGFIIGHEFTHGFDTMGGKYDEHGAQKKWWTEQTGKAFEEKSECFVEQYANYYIEEIQQYVNSTRSLDENLADNGGLRSAYRAFRKLFLRSDYESMMQDFTPEQLFFIGFGSMWCSNETPEYLLQLNKRQGYAPNKFRVIGSVSNMPEFSEAFNCPQDSPMNPRRKCSLW